MAAGDRRTAAYSLSPVSPGGGSYFSHTSEVLDPRLFDSGNKVKERVRQGLISPLLSWFWEHGYAGAGAWLRVYLAGSAITYLWQKQGKGDLDVLLGIDQVEFRRLNRGYRGLSEVEVAEHINAGLKRDLWPQMEDYLGFEVTYYVNPHSADIRDINPYAAYDLIKNEWVVQPLGPGMPDPESRFPAEYRMAAMEEGKYATALVDTASELINQLSGVAPGSPHETNLQARLGHVVKTGSALYESVHSGRREAFKPGGKGYWDYANYRWQHAKQTGWIKPLSEMAKLHGLKVWNPDEYGEETPSGRTALIRALIR